MSENTVGKANVEFGFTGLSAVQGAIGKLSSGLMGLSAGGLAMLGLGAGIAATIGLSISKAMEAQEVESSLRSALKNTGQEVDGNMERFQKLAANLQQVTKQDDEATLALARTSLEMGNSASVTEQLTKAAVGLAGTGLISAEDAMVQLTKEANGMKNSLAKTFPQLAGVSSQTERLAIVSDLASQGMQQQFDAAGTTAGGWEHLKQTVDNLLETLGGLFLPILDTIIGVVQEFIDWITQLSGAIADNGMQTADCLSGIGGAWDWLKGVIGTVVSFIRSCIEGIIFAVLNWKTMFTLAGTQIALAVSRIGDYLIALWNNTVKGLTWLMDNWKEIFTDIFNFTIEIVKDIGQNIAAGWEWAWEQISGEKAKTKFKALAEDFKSVTKEGLTFDGVGKTDMTKALESDVKRLNAEMAKSADKWAQNMEKNAKPAAEAVKAELLDIGKIDIQKEKGAKDPKDKKDKDAQLTGIVDVWKKTQTGMIEEKDKVAKEQLAEAKKNNAAMEKNNKALDEINNKLAVA